MLTVGGMRDHADTTCHAFRTSFWPERKLLSVKLECSIAYFILCSSWCLGYKKIICWAKSLLCMGGILQSYSVLTLGTVLYCRVLVMFYDVTKTALIFTYLIFPQFFIQLIHLKGSLVVPLSFKDLPHHVTKPVFRSSARVFRSSVPVFATCNTNPFFKSLKSFWARAFQTLAD